jgi:hypothetical protein
MSEVPDASHEQLVPAVVSVSLPAGAEECSAAGNLSTITSTEAAEAIKEYQLAYSTLKQTPFEKNKNCTLVQNTTNTKSPSWAVFHVFCPTNHPELCKFASCNYCGAKVNFKNGTAGLKGHIRSCQLGAYKQLFPGDGNTVSSSTSGHQQGTDSKKRQSEQQDIRDSFKKQNGGNIPIYKNAKDREEAQKTATVRWIAKTLQPLSVVEHSYFREMIKTHNPSARHLTSRVVSESMMQLHDKIVASIVKTVDPHRCTFTIDHWSSIAKQNYTGLTAHWIGHDFKLNNVQLGCFLHEGESSADAVVDDFLVTVLGKLRVLPENIHCVVSDTASNMNGMGKILERGNVPHLYCTDHLLQLTAKLAYDDKNFDEEDAGNNFDLDPCAVTMGKARSLINHIAKSNQATEKLLNAQKHMNSYVGKAPVKVVVDVVTRWWSTWSAIDRLLYLRPAIQHLLADNQLPQKFMLLEAEWELLKDTKVLLDPFKKTQKYLEGEKYVTISMIPVCIRLIRKQLKETIQSADTNGYVKALASRMLKSFESYWGVDDFVPFDGKVVRGFRGRQVGVHPVVTIAAALDIRCKNLSFIRDQQTKDEVFRTLLDLMKKISPQQVQPAAETQQQDPAGENDSDPFFDMLMEMNNEGNNEGNCRNGQKSLEEELEEYKSVPHRIVKSDGLAEVDKGMDPVLVWWRDNQQRFPTLAKLARFYLAIPATSAPTERIFSVASKVLTKFRSRLHSSKAGDLIFVYQNLEWYDDHISLE